MLSFSMPGPMELLIFVGAPALLAVVIYSVIKGKDK